MAATDKTELRTITEKEFAKLIKLLDGLDEDLANQPDKDDAVSIKQVIGHRVHWMDLFFGWYEDGKAGREVEVPAPGYKWNQLKPYNAKVYEAAAEQSWANMMAQLKEHHATFLALIDSLDDDVLYAKHIYPWTNDWTLGRWAESSGPSHYRSAAKFVRKVKREAAA